MQVYKPGTLIELKLNKQKAVIVSATIRQRDVIYNVDYFVSEELKDCSVYEFEFDIIGSTTKQRIGFK